MEVIFILVKMLKSPFSYFWITWAIEATAPLYYYYTYTTAILHRYIIYSYLLLDYMGRRGYSPLVIPKLQLLLRRYIIYTYLLLDYMGYRGHSPLILELYLYDSFYYYIGISPIAILQLLQLHRYIIYA